MALTAADLQAIWLSLRLAAITTLILLVIGTGLGWWLARTRSWWKAIVEAFVSLPLVLPPTVLGFYLLVAMGPQGALGRLTDSLGLGTLPFTFWGLVVASSIYSLPFVVRPIQNAMEAMGDRPLEVAATLGAGPFDRFFSVVLPMARPGLLTAAILGFAHTLGEFGVVLMIGGNIPGVTRVISVHIYDQVEALEFGRAHMLAALMVAFSFAILVTLHFVNRRRRAPFGGGI